MKDIDKIINPEFKCCVNLDYIPSVYDEALTIEEQILWLKKHTREEILKLYKEIEGLSSDIESDLKEYLDLELNNAVLGINASIENVYTTLDNKINETIVGEINVINPTNGQLENINKVLGDIYDANRIYAISCEEFDNLELSASEYDDKLISAYDFDNFGLEILN